jgi:hypothetical protein
MSIATLKKKTKAVRNLSKDGFSLNGPYRNVRSVGGYRNASGTKFNGLYPKGHGSYQDTYKLNITNNYGYYDTTLSSQRSVMNSNGLLSSRVYRPTRSTDAYNGSSGCSLNQGCTKLYVKNFNPMDHSQSEYTKQIKNYETGLSLVECPDTPVVPCSDDNIYMLGTRKISRNTYAPSSPLTARSCGEYMNTVLLPQKCLPTPPCKQSFPMKLHNDSCGKVYTDPQQAMDDGLLPTNWMNCQLPV